MRPFVDQMMNNRICVRVVPGRLRSWDHRKLGMGEMPVGGSTAAIPIGESMDPNNKPKQLNSPFVTKVMKYAGKAHVWVYRKSGGKIGANWRVGAGLQEAGADVAARAHRTEVR